MPKALTVASYLTVGEFADRLNVCEKTVRRAIDAGELPVHRIGRLVRIAVEDAAAFMAIRRR